MRHVFMDRQPPRGGNERRKRKGKLLTNDPTSRYRDYVATLPWGARGPSSSCNAETYQAALRGVSMGLHDDRITQIIADAIRRAGCTPRDRDIEHAVDSARKYASPDEPARGVNRNRGSRNQPPPPPDPLDELRRISPEWASDPGDFLGKIFLPGEKVGIADGGTMEQTPLSVWQHGQAQLGIIATSGAWFLSNPITGGLVERTSARGRKYQTNRTGECVSAYPFFVLESDTLTPEKSVALFRCLPLPIAAIYTSGGRSVHALVRIDAPSKEAWDRAIKPRKGKLGQLGFDAGALSAVRLTRLPFCQRTEKGAEQRLLYLAGRSVNFVNLENPQPLPGDMWQAFDKWLARHLEDDLEAEGGGEEATAEDLEALRWNPDDEPDNRPAVATFCNRVDLRRGNVSQVTAKAKAGKTSFLTALMAASVDPATTADCLGWRCHESKGAILYFDFEQSRDDFIMSCRGCFKRINRDPRQATHFRAYRFRDKTLDARFSAMNGAVERACRECGSIRLIVVDGGADLLADVNDPVASGEVVDQLLRLSTEHDCHVAVVVHSNESMKAGADARGHLGKQLQRKCECTFFLSRNEGVVEVHNGNVHRKAGVPSTNPFVFAWNEAEGRFTSEGFRESARLDDLTQDLVELAAAIAKGDLDMSLRSNDICSSIMEIRGCAQRTAERKLSAMRKAGILTYCIVSGYYGLGELPTQALRDAKANKRHSDGYRHTDNLPTTYRHSP